MHFIRRRGSKRCAGLALGLLALSLAAAADAQLRFTIPLVVDFEDPRYGAFHSRVEAGLQGSVVDGRLVAEASQPPGGCRMSTSTLSGEGTAATFVRVVSEVVPEQKDSDLPSGAGLIVRYAAGEQEPVREVRFLGLLLRDGEYRVVSFEDGKFTDRLRGAVPGGPSVLVSARETEGGAEFFVDAVRVGNVRVTGFDGTGVGLVHCGSGRFQFDTWGLNTRGDVGFDEALVHIEDAPTAQSADPEDTVEGAVSGEPPPEPVTGSGHESVAVSPPESPQSSGAEWWVEQDGQPTGPIPLIELRARLADGRATSDARVWREGMDDWVPAAEALR